LINGGRHCKRLQSKVTVNVRLTEAVALPASKNKLKKQKKEKARSLNRAWAWI
jgi:hypothetical protein